MMRTAKTSTRRRIARRTMAATWIVVCCSSIFVRTTYSQDVIHVMAEPGSDQITRLTGEVVDFTGRQLTLARPGGQEQRYPADRIADVETTRSAEQLAARQFVAQQKYDEALRQLETAASVETRPWVRREILAELVWCLCELDQQAKAGEVFLALVESDPETQYFPSIPLAWVTVQPSPDLERRAVGWLADASPVAGLIGASHLLPTGDKTAAVERLKQLMIDRDPRVRALARAQLWRTDTVTVNDEELNARLGEVEKIPAGLRGGPALVLGQTLAARQEHQRAALWLLRLPLVEGRPRRLAARALHDAAQSLEHVGQQPEAILLYDELATDYAATPEGRDARARLSEARANRNMPTDSPQ